MRTRLLLIVIMLLAGATGCVQLPKPVSPQEAPRPAMTTAEAQRVHAAVSAKLKQADQRRDYSLADDVLVDAELTMRESDYDHKLRYHDSFGSLELGTKIINVYPSSAAVYPQQALVVSTRKPTRYDRSDRLLEVYERSDATAPWKRSAGVGLTRSELPKLERPSPDVTTMITAKKFRGLELSSMGPLSAAFENPKSQRTFQPSSALSMWHEYRVSEAKRLKCRTVQTFYGPRPPLVLPTADGGGLAIGSMAIGHLIRCTDGSGIYWPKLSDLHKEYPKTYATVSERYELTALIRLSRTKKPRLVGYRYAWLGTSGSEPVN